MKSIEELNQEVLKERLCEDTESKIKAYLHQKHQTTEDCEDNLNETESEVDLCVRLLNESINDCNETIKKLQENPESIHEKEF